MTKVELVNDVAERVQLPKYQTATVVTCFLQGIIDALRAGDTVQLRGFGSFRLSRQRPRVRRNPQTGHTFQMPAIQVPRFTASKVLRARVNQPKQ